MEKDEDFQHTMFYDQQVCFCDHQATGIQQTEVTGAPTLENSLLLTD